MAYVPAAERYDAMRYNRCGASGLKLPAVSLGLWHNFGHDRPLDSGRAIVRRAFDLGVTHFDLANNYGPPYGSAEENFGRLLAQDLAPYRDELVISTKAGYDMWPGPYGEWGSRKYLLASLDQSLRRIGLDYVDIFYSHRFDPETPLEETMGALDAAVRQGKALYAGISSYSAEKTREAAAILDSLGTPLLIHQPSYSMLNRWIEGDLLDALGELGVGCIVFSPLAQGMLTDRYLDGIPEGSRATQHKSLSPDLLTEEALAKIRALNEIAQGRGQSLAQLALAWALRDPRVTSTLIGASSVAQLETNVAALDRLELSADELAEIDRHATDSGINLWAASSRELDARGDPVGRGDGLPDRGAGQAGDPRAGPDAVLADDPDRARRCRARRRGHRAADRFGSQPRAAATTSGSCSPPWRSPPASSPPTGISSRSGRSPGPGPGGSRPGASGIARLRKRLTALGVPVERLDGPAAAGPGTRAERLAELDAQHERGEIAEAEYIERRKQVLREQP